MKETNLMRLIMLSLSKLKCKVFRNHVGLIKSSDGTVHRFGLCVGSSDIIGFIPIVINGKRIAVFMALEVKTTVGKITNEQASFIDMVNSNGGVGAVVRSINEAEDIIHKYIANINK